MRKLNRKFVTIFLTILVALAAAACPDPKTPGDPAATDETAATVNGNPIMLQEVERAIKATAQGQETKLSPMELAQARLQVLQQLIQQEVMYQKAQKEETIPSDDDVNAELNKRKTGSGLSKEEFEK
ncbi:MAG: SurA N-terminal domain-containing protein, partial [Acidobacteriota bacterium]|nr:SurA N-terminal domain-containing protein [Acidobacteriota bacterium]